MFGKVVGGIMGMIAFAVAALVGLIAGNDVATVLTRALVAMGVFFAVGFLLGTMGRRLIDEHMSRMIDDDRQKQIERINQTRDAEPAAGETEVTAP